MMVKSCLTLEPCSIELHGNHLRSKSAKEKCHESFFLSGGARNKFEGGPKHLFHKFLQFFGVNFNILRRTYMIIFICLGFIINFNQTFWLDL